MMTELSLNILDIAQNSIKAKASLISIFIEKKTDIKQLFITISDNGCGMTDKQLKHITDPFFTSRTTRKVGLGVPFFKMSAEITGGTFNIESEIGKGTIISVNYFYENIDMLPIGDMSATMTALIRLNPDIDFVYIYSIDKKNFTLDTRKIKNILKGYPIDSNEVITFIKNFINENQNEINNNKLN